DANIRAGLTSFQVHFSPGRAFPILPATRVRLHFWSVHDSHPVPAAPRPRLHTDRTVGSNRDYCNPHWIAPPRGAEGARGRLAHELLEQPQAADRGVAQLSLSVREVPPGVRDAIE